MTMLQKNHQILGKSFWSLFVIQFFGALNDNFFKNVIILMITYQSWELFGLNSQSLVSFCAGIFILPFFFLSFVSGQWADRLSKVQLIRWIKLAEVMIGFFAVFSFYTHFQIGLLLCLVFYGIHSAVFGPVKYSIIPLLVKPNQIIKANGVISAGTFVAILLGTLFGGLAAQSSGTHLESFAVILFAGIGLFFTFRIGPIENEFEHLDFGKKLKLKSEKRLKPLLVSISWFWLMGAAILTLLPLSAKNYFNGTESVATFFLFLFTFGMGAGSLLVQRILKGEMNFHLVIFSLIAMSFILVDLSLSHKALPYPMGHHGVFELLQNFAFLRVVFDYLIFALLGGLFSVPLYSALQVFSPKNVMAQVIAWNNVLNSIFMVAISIALMILLQKQYSIGQCFAFLASINFLFLPYLYFKLGTKNAKSNYC